MPHFKFRNPTPIEARQWIDTDEKREEFAQWFEAHNCVFETLGPRVSCGCFSPVYADPGDWIVLTDDDVEEFFVPIKPDVFASAYEEIK